MENSALQKQNILLLLLFNQSMGEEDCLKLVSHFVNFQSENVT